MPDRVDHPCYRRCWAPVLAVDLAAAAGQHAMSLSLLFGTDPSGDDCITARRVPCDPTSTRTRCKQ